MNINAKKMEEQSINIPYEQPSLKKYGTMKEFTLGLGGSGGECTTVSAVAGDTKKESSCNSSDNHALGDQNSIFD
jgi:hypothetical protein